MTIVTVGLVAVAAALAVIVALAGALALDKTKAQGAADASALAAASDARDRRALGQSYRGADPPSCRVAREVAERWGAAVASCGVGPGGVVTVEVTVAAGVGEVGATAKAGPTSRSRRRVAEFRDGRGPRRQPRRETAAPGGHRIGWTRETGGSLCWRAARSRPFPELTRMRCGLREPRRIRES
jgi:hypothetical protein